MPSSKKLIQWAATSLRRRGGSGGETPVQQVSHLGKASNSVPWFPYGFDANVPPNELSVLLGLLGRDSRAHLPGSPGKAPATQLGEVVVFHPTTGSKVHFLQDGSIQVVAGLASVVVTATGGITLNPGAVPVTINGDLVVTGSITAASVAASGGVTIGTTLAVTGATTLGAVVTSGGTNISGTHVHSGVTAGAANTGGPL